VGVGNRVVYVLPSTVSGLRLGWGGGNGRGVGRAVGDGAVV
jgi:hypothetical protein